MAEDTSEEVNVTPQPSMTETQINWITLPNDEPGILLRMFDQHRVPTDDLKEVYGVRAVDRFTDIWEFEPDEKTFTFPFLH